MAVQTLYQHVLLQTSKYCLQHNNCSRSLFMQQPIHLINAVNHDEICALAKNLLLFSLPARTCNMLVRHISFMRFMAPFSMWPSVFLCRRGKNYNKKCLLLKLMRRHSSAYATLNPLYVHILVGLGLYRWKIRANSMACRKYKTGMEVYDKIFE